MAPGTSTRRRPARRHAGARAFAGVVVSLAFNALALLALARAGAFAAASARSAPIAISSLTAERWQANRAIAAPPAAERPPEPAAPAAAAPPAAPPRRERPQAEAGGPVIRVAPSQDGRRPDRARYRSDRDNTVARDVQSREAGKRTWDTTLAAPEPGPSGVQGIPLPGDGGRDEASVPGKEGAPGEGAGDAVTRARRALAPTPAPAGDAAGEPGSPAGRDPAVGAGDARRPGTGGEGGLRRSGRYDPRLLPNASSFERLSGGPGPRLPDVEEGDATAIATRRFKYADFHLRVKESVVREWDPNRAFDARDPDARRYGRSARGATVDIVLEANGALREVRLVKTSGLDFYDRELVRAIHAAAPFPNPPRGLVGANGLIVLRSWRFNLVFGDPAPPALGLSGGAHLPR